MDRLQRRERVSFTVALIVSGKVTGDAGGRARRWSASTWALYPRTKSGEFEWSERYPLQQKQLSRVRVGLAEGTRRAWVRGTRPSLIARTVACARRSPLSTAAADQWEWAVRPQSAQFSRRQNCTRSPLYGSITVTYRASNAARRLEGEATRRGDELWWRAVIWSHNLWALVSLTCRRSEHFPSAPSADYLAVAVWPRAAAAGWSKLQQCSWKFSAYVLCGYSYASILRHYNFTGGNSYSPNLGSQPHAPWPPIGPGLCN